MSGREINLARGKTKERLYLNLLRKRLSIVGVSFFLILSVISIVLISLYLFYLKEIKRNEQKIAALKTEIKKNSQREQDLFLIKEKIKIVDLFLNESKTNYEQYKRWLNIVSGLKEKGLKITEIRLEKDLTVNGSVENAELLRLIESFLDGLVKEERVSFASCEKLNKAKEGGFEVSILIKQ